MFIQTEDTPNPQALKFLPGKPIGGSQGKTFNKDSQTTDHRLVESLFAIDGVEQIYFGADFMTVTKAQESEWIFLKPQILGSLMDYFLDQKVSTFESTSGVPEKAHDSALSTHEKTAIEIEICEIIDARIRPAVAQDGGDIVFDRFEEGVVYVHLQGACSGCPSSQLTLKSGIENTLKYYVPEVIEVRSL